MRHALRNGLIPIITLVALLIPEAVAGAVITEQIFAWNGMGQLAVNAASDRDPAVMMAIIVIVGSGRADGEHHRGHRLRGRGPARALRSRKMMTGVIEGSE